MTKTIITAALIGTGPTRQQSEFIPITPEEIACSAIEAYQAGAAIAHIHVRDPETQANCNRLALFEEVVTRIRSACDMVLNLTTGTGGALYVDPKGNIVEAFSDIQGPESRVAHVLALKPELCSLDIGTMNWGPGIFVNSQEVVEEMAAMIRDSGTKPEIELFDIGHIEIAQRLINRGLVAGKPHFQVCLGTEGGLAASPRNAVFFSESLPPGSTWSVFGVSRHQFPMVGMGVLLGGHVRVGFEDNLYLKKGVKARSNAELVERAVAVLRAFDQEPATSAEARELLGL
jgi:uncharacterized protein (DUF849 family)